MGNNSSSHQHYAAGGGLAQEMGRGWTHSFPRELTRHSQPQGLKVLPEPPNQRLRATNNGSIIHNGGTISGRRPSALTLPHNLNKQAAYRSRSTSATGYSNAGRTQNSSDQCCHYPGESRDSEMSEMKRFGSEPDLRYSPSERRHEPRHQGYSERDARERESRYKGKKKYKAPAPPANGDSSPDSYKWEIGLDRETRSDEIQPPPRRSRLFKTRAETKRAQVNWTSLQERVDVEQDKRWLASRQERVGKENIIWREQEERWDREERRSKHFDGKNTLQRSLSSPEFQAELMQVARKVRNKLNYKREAPVGEAAPANHRGEVPGRTQNSRTADDRNARRHEDRFDDRRMDKRSGRSQEEYFEDRRNGDSRLVARLQNDRRFDDRRPDGRRSDSLSKESFENRQDEIRNSKHELLRKSTTYDGTSEPVDGSRRGNGRKSLNDRLDARGHSLDKQRRDCSEEMSRHGDRAKNRKLDDVIDSARTRSESPVRQFRDKVDLRGQGSGRESTPEPPRSKDRDSNDSRRRNVDLRSNVFKSNEKRKSEPVTKLEAKETKTKEKLYRKTGDVKGVHERNWEILSPTDKSPPKTFYFGMDESLSNKSRDCIDQLKSSLQSMESSPEGPSIDVDDSREKNGTDDIALKLRPTLPKKQLEIPRFSPSAAWRLLSALETPGPTMSTASEDCPVLFEERIERLSRGPPPIVALGPRSSHDKSGDSGISGDAGAVNDDSLDITAIGRTKTAVRPTWTPQQDLGEESSSDAGVDSPPPMVTPVKFPPRAHVFSLSLPRDDNRMSLYSSELKSKDSPPFNSLQKLKRSVSGALGLGLMDLERKQRGDTLDDNWMLSTSAPNSLQHNQVNESAAIASPVWEPGFGMEDMEEDEEDKSDFPIIMKPPSFSYLASGGHVMYLPESSGTEYQTQSLTYRNTSSENDKTSCNAGSKYRKNMEDVKKSSRYPTGSAEIERSSKIAKDLGLFRERSFNDLRQKSYKYSSFSKSCENISEMKQRGRSPSPGPENLQDAKETLSDLKITPKQNSKSKRFTFQSTVRQIERRRLAEKLSREAEAKERQRKGELEAMRKVEEEFQKKRAREKASIRQQLRLFSMDENISSLPTVWDNNTQLSRADPDGAPSSSASSPTSATPGKLAATRKNSASSDEYNRKIVPGEEYRQQQQQQREYKDYRPRYYDWAPENSSHIEYKHTTVHPKVVYDIPKSNPVFIDANVHIGKPINPNGTPRSDNYRKDFAHGAVAARSSLASSDSELSQPNTRPHSRQTGNKNKPLRSRSASPARSEDVVSSEDEIPLEAIKQERSPLNGLMLNGIQPFVREKSYRPISFNPQPPPPIPS
ncbi:biorientation of chromosomes in cell division protein 1-like 1 isoform X2 [Cephus cinctus]|uniref:Biorientation of chromosomes in cell division protein 1-like 1 isoform X2 n=1 Tax=Cephus cinctus TaxID=211228 RepID=A0AAJ7BG87_CEPCN|nr:biorientation of chromosomes in cell division protein 1-like 1 isoform X2 [Cephus cinctus]